MNTEMDVHEKKEVAEQEATRPGRLYSPDVDIAETPDRLLLWADMPGVDEKSIEVTLDDGVLSIEGHVGVEDYESLSPLYTEYNIGDYRRRFTVASEIDPDRIQARVVNGVLEIELPKSEKVKMKRIPVSAA